jgi:hypothetical protein
MKIGLIKKEEKYIRSKVIINSYSTGKIFSTKALLKRPLFAI